MSPGCVDGSNIELRSSQTVEQCAEWCDQRSDCKAFEYGVPHGGTGTTYKPGDCQLQNAVPNGQCDGAHFNLDVYTKTGVEEQEGEDLTWITRQFNKCKKHAM